MGIRKDMVGEVYGRLTVVRYAGNKQGNAAWECICECGNIVNAFRIGLIKGHTKSCGCLKRTTSYKWAKPKTSTYHIWQSMKQRCNNNTRKDYERYGGRGIKVCSEWNNYDNFLADMGERPDGLSLDRIDNDGDYCKDNCKWATLDEQNNNKRSNRNLEYNGEIKTMRQWSNETEIPYGVLNQRIFKGWSIERAIKTPIRNRGKIKEAL